MKPSPQTVLLCVIGIALAGVVMFAGAILPFMKSASFIDAERNVSNVHTVQDFEQNFNNAFDFPSPVGDEELTKFLAGNILNIVQGGQSEAAARELVAYIEPHLYKDEVRHLLLDGQLHQSLWQLYHSEDDYQAAVKAYAAAHEIGPDLPPPLYSLLSLYTAHLDLVNGKRIAGEILARWPDDAKVNALFK